MKKKIYFLIVIVVLLISSCSKKQEKYDIVIYGGSSAGVIAAYSAKKLGKSVLLIEPRYHLGGLTSGGLGATDIGNKYAVTGLSRDFYRRLGRHYGKLEMWEFEPKVAEKIMNDYIREASVEVLYWHRLKSVETSEGKISSITVEDSKNPSTATDRTISAKVFIDATYEGDLMAKANVSYIVGREANAQYNETYNGVQWMEKNQLPPVGSEMDIFIDPYIIPGDSTSGFCYGIQADTLQPDGTGDKRVQAYNYRLCLTQDTTNFVPVTRPACYDSTHYEILRRLILERDRKGWKQPLGSFYLRIIPMPNGKTDVNNKGGFSTDFIGMNWDYPEADYQRREEIEKEHQEYIKGLLYFLGHDPALPEEVKQQMLSWGWAKDEFTDTDNFPFQMYVREARRMIGEFVMTQHHCEGKEMVDDGIGMAAYTMDSHNCQRVVIKKDGKHYVQNEGDVQVGGFPPYPIAYRSIVPKRSECTNLLVPVCLSASHIAYGSIRMEPVFMVMGQSSAIAASMAIDAGCNIQDINVQELQSILRDNPLLNESIPEILIDNSDTSSIAISGTWNVVDDWGKYKLNFLTSELKTSGQSVEFRINVPSEASYHLYFYVPLDEYKDYSLFTKKINARLKIGGKEQEVVISCNQVSRDWVHLGKFEFSKEVNQHSLIITDNSNDSITFADALLLIPE